MHRTAVAAACLLSLVPLAAQTSTAFTGAASAAARAPTARAAFALALLEEIARLRDDAVAAGRGPRVERELVGRFALAGYTTLFVHAPALDGAIVVARSYGIDVPDDLDAQRWAVYACPRTAETAENAEPTFFLAADGAVMCTDGAGERGDASLTPAPIAAFGKGGGGTWNARPRSAGVGEDGRLWRLASTLPRERCELQLRTADGRPLAGVEVLLSPADGVAVPPGAPPGVPLPGRWPAGVATPGTSGTAQLHGVAAGGLVVRASLGGTLVTLAPDAVRAEAGTVRVTLSADLQDPKRLRANEQAAMATLRNIASAQAQCQAAGVIDADGDGVGEFGFFAELAGAAPVRSDADGGVGETRISPPVLSTAFARVRGARVRRSGYCFQVFLPGADGAWATEQPDGDGARGVRVAPDRAERRWACVAWPAVAGWTGRRAFTIDQDGVVLAHANDDAAFSGETGVMPPTDAPAPGFVPADQARPAR